MSSILVLLNLLKELLVIRTVKLLKDLNPIGIGIEPVVGAPCEIIFVFDFLFHK